MKILKNAPFDTPNTILIKEGTPEWESAYQSWLSGKNPTDSPEWKKGVYMALVVD